MQQHLANTFSCSNLSQADSPEREGSSLETSSISKRMSAFHVGWRSCRRLRAVDEHGMGMGQRRTSSRRGRVGRGVRMYRVVSSQSVIWILSFALLYRRIERRIHREKNGFLKNIGPTTNLASSKIYYQAFSKIYFRGK